MSKTDTLWLSAFGLGFLASFGVLNPTPGIGLFLGVNALVAALWYFGMRNTEAKEIKATSESRTLLMVLTGFYVALSVPYLYRLDFSIVGVLVGVHISFLLMGALYFALPSALHILDILSLIISPIAFGLNWLVETFKAFFELFRGNANVVRLILKVVLYAAASLIVFIFFAKLLSAADAEFKVRIDDILESLDLVVVMQRTLIGVILSFVAAGLLTIVGLSKALPMFGVVQERAKELLDKAFSVFYSKRSDALLPVIVTTPLLFLFALYVWVQFSYLFGKDIAEILKTYSFATYAHRGFAELLIVGILSYPLLAWSMSQSRSEWKLPRFVTFMVNTGIVSMLVVMLYSLVMRISLYIDVYGPSLLRSYVVVGAIFVGIALVVYEIFAIFKTAKSEFSVFHGRIMNDYVIVAILTALSLLGALSFYPWSRATAAQLMAQYEESGKVDVFQLNMLPLEAQDQVFQFGQTLQTDGLNESGLLLQASAVKKVDEYREQRADSIFPSVFGFNLTQFTLAKNIPENKQEEMSKKFKDAMDLRIAATKESFNLALITNNFVSARSYFDTEMKNNDIAGFADGVSVEQSLEGSTYNYRDPGYSASDSFLGGSKSTYESIRYTIVRDGTKSKVDTTISLAFSFRNGKVVLTDSGIVLSYLPDAISERGDNYEIAQYGYRTFCTVPTLEVLYSARMGCESQDAYYEGVDRVTEPIEEPMKYDTRPMGEFLESDFATEPKE